MLCYATPSSTASLKSRICHLSEAGLLRLSWKEVTDWVSAEHVHMSVSCKKCVELIQLIYIKQCVDADGFTLAGFTFLVPAHPGSPGQIPEEQ